MKRWLKTAFVYKRGGVDTAEIRGRQMATALGCDLVRLADLTPEVGARYEALIYVKIPAAASVMDEIGRRGVRQFVDVLDNYGWRSLRRVAPFVDTFVGANLTHAVYLAKLTGRAAVELEHHHCNFDELRIPHGRGPTLGFIAGQKQWPMNRRIVGRLGYPVVHNGVRKGEGAFASLIDAYMATDVGFAYRMESNKLRFNCANKLTNYMSFGIPSVLTPEGGYLEFARHGETCFYAHNKEDFALLVQHLARDPELRRRMGDAAYEAARPFHISRIAERYRDFLGSF
ncbi:MAG TPA: glycosyltransferase [Longimicrobium sp.]|nr:glycosyltransferase [Longimicrobium sp.]